MWFIVADFSGSERLFLRSGNDLPVNLYQMNVTLCPDRKGQGPKAHLSPSKVPVLIERKQISFGSSFRARFPQPAQLSSLREPGTQLNWPSVSSAAQMGRPGPTNCGSYRRPLLLGHRDRGKREVHCCLKAGPRPVEAL